jgi:Zn-dependent protease
MPEMPPSEPVPPSQRLMPPRPVTWWDKVKKAFAPIGVGLFFIAKFFSKAKFILLPILKFLPAILKTGGTMILSIGFYAMSWGWRFALGFVLLIFIHECGHLVIARRFGLNVGAPVFIPFMGAFIALKDAPRNAWMEAWVGIGGPLFGAAGALVCDFIYVGTGNPLFRGLAYSGFFLNLFNLAPIGFLDGGRIATVLSPWLWVVGLVIMAFMAITHPNFVVIMIIVMSLPRLWSLFRAKTPEEQRYFEVTPRQRWTMAALYFGLAALLIIGMHYTLLPPPPQPAPMVN